MIMDPFFHTPLVYRASLAFISTFILFSPTPFCHSVQFRLSRFSPDVNIVLLKGEAVISVGKIEFNSPNIYRVGQAIYNGKVPLWDSSSGKVADFTTHFSFTIDTQNRSQYGDGLAFFLAPVGFHIMPNSAGGFLGLFNTSTPDSAQPQIVSVEFDSFSNLLWDPPFQHVGINLNSISSSVTMPWNITLHSGDKGDAWIVYNSTRKNISVFWSYGEGPNSSLSYEIDLKEVLPEWVTVGISAATGLGVERHTLESWEFSSNLEINENGGNSPRKMGLIIGLPLLGCMLIVVAVLGLVFLRKRKRDHARDIGNPEAANLTSLNNELERGSGPRKFSYKDLASATNNFSEERKLGEGGFGGVYKGHLVDLDVPIAVKKFSSGSKQGKKQYITEVKIISMLRHRNLVQLIGWCHDKGEFLLVYEFMPNRSLDYHLFGNMNPLVWTLRYKITLGLASSLLYLHEEWEQCVIHRDIKSSNVMLDSSFNVKLGDFGLARLTEHELGPQTTGLAGTLGYLAPEYVIMGRASKESDVYSFGVVVLEIVTGRKSVGPFDKDSQKGLVEWVWEIYGKGKLISAADERLQMEYEPKQVECLLIVGLGCAHPDANMRPSIRQAARVLNFEAEMPKLATKMPVAVYSAPSPLVSSGEPLSISSSINMGR